MALCCQFTCICLVYCGVHIRYGNGVHGNTASLSKDLLVDLALSCQDDELRRTYYSDLDQIYVDDVPSFPIAQPQTRKWVKYWVRGWSYNALRPYDYFYRLYKLDTCWANVNGPTVGVPDGLTDMRDVTYIANHVNAKAPNPNVKPPNPMYDPMWAPGTYGCGGCDGVGDRKVDMRDVAFAASHFLHRAQP
jgi:hypothetical protein